MFRANERRQGMSAAIFGLWRNWAVAVGLLTVLTVLAPVVPRQWLAPINIGFYILLQIFHTELRKRDFPSCWRLIQQGSAVLWVSAVDLSLFLLLSRRATLLRALRGIASAVVHS